MKKSALLLILIFFSFLFSGKLFAQQIPDALKVKELVLDNGLTVYLNEDHFQPNVYGAVCIKGGSKRDPKDATGIAHYLEHMLFKGTNEMGTINFSAEKIYLDSITLKYDELGKTTDENERLAIQKKINMLSLKAAEYAIPNEFDKIMADIGGTGVNAYTTEDNIVYFNNFPPNQMEKWLEIYSHRFIDPIFRLFQSELETVYEEKNMSMDNLGDVLIETFLAKMYRKHPYGQQTVLGSIEHLKNPSLSKMYEYFQTYYVPNNMALILSGDFNSEEVIPLIREKFGRWKAAEIPPLPKYPEEEFKGREFNKVRLSPIPLGVVGFRTIPQGHEDEIVLDVCNEILSNGAGIGFLDKLYIDNKIMLSGMFQYSHIDNGVGVLFFAPKLFQQSLKNAEKLVLNEVGRIAAGEFDDEYLEAIKLNMIKNHYKSLEEMRSRPYYILDCFLTGEKWEDVIAYPEKLTNITRDDVIRVAKKYYGKNYLVMYSKIGIPKKEKLEKPPFKPVIPQNTEAKSNYYQNLDNIEVKKTEPRFVEFSKDIQQADIRDNLHLYYNPNPVNQIFSLSVKFGVGSYEIPVLEYAGQYMSLIGTESQSFIEFSKAMQKLGSSYSIYSTKDAFIVSLNGLEENLEPTLVLLNSLLNHMQGDEKQLEKFSREAKTGLKAELKDPSTVGDALNDYVMYKDQSYYIRRLSLNEIKSLTSEQLLDAVKKAMTFEINLHYSGQLKMDIVIQLLTKNIQLPDNLQKSNSPVYIPLQVYSEPAIFLVDEPKAIQSQVYILREGKVTDLQQRAFANAFNEYFGTGMSSIIFQEIREFRSLAYSAYASYKSPYYLDKPGYLSGFLSTQSDKTIEALEAMIGLIDTIPVKPERMETVRNAIILSISANRPGFRNLSVWVEYWQKIGYTDDPRKLYVPIWQNMNFEDIQQFYYSNVGQSPIIIAITGDKKRIDMEKLAQFGKIIEVKKEDVFKK
ncbi:M16 family metallopeptidase [Bacteroidota bacterium]